MGRGIGITMPSAMSERIEMYQRWADALESGEYARCQDHLRRPSGFCCLGVLCDIWGKGKWGDGYIYQTATGERREVMAYPPDPLEALMGMSMGCVGTYDFTAMNDSNGSASFREIANVIRTKIIPELEVAAQ